MSFELPALPYAKNALEPYISERTLNFHYGKHHQAYVSKLNILIQGTEFEMADLETVIRKAEGGIFNNGAQVWNHSFYFEQFSSAPVTEPSGPLKTAVEKTYGSFFAFQEAFSAAAATLFGSGWAWLVRDEAGELRIIQSGNAGNPLRDGFKPLMTCDVWEHAYYLDKQNARPEYIADFWKVLDWEVIEKRF
ncbi:MAG: superoxide dismutase [Mangrovibacterium sp.]